MRLITLMDGTGMGNSLIVFETDAPVKELKELEKISCQVYIDKRDDSEVPIWSKVLSEKGYTFEYVNEHQHITPYGSSSDWIEREYPEIQEHYIIENQPD